MFSDKTTVSFGGINTDEQTENALYINRYVNDVDDKRKVFVDKKRCERQLKRL